MVFFKSKLENRDDSWLVAKYISTKKDRYFEELMRRYGTILYNYIKKMIGYNSSGVDDVYQNIWIKISSYMDRYKEENKFKNFLFFVATNSCYDHLRSLKRENENRFNPIVKDDDKGDFFDKISTTEDIIKSIEQKELTDKINLVVDTLPQKQKEVFLLRGEGFTFKEISSMIDVPINSLLSRMRYAVEKIRKGLENGL